MVAQGQLRRLRVGWYAQPAADPTIVRAVTAGGTLACVSALALHGVWTPDRRILHVRRHRNFRSHPLERGIVDCGSGGDLPAARRSVDPLPVALRSAWRCLPTDEFVAVADSLWLMGLDPAQVAEILGGGRDVLNAVALMDRAESGTESLVRLRLRRRRLRVRAQIEIEGVGRVDLLVGDRLVIEVDSRAHHTGTENHSRDRWRDLRLHERGFVVLRLTWAQVMHHWDEVEPVILALASRRAHVRRGR